MAQIPELFIELLITLQLGEALVQWHLTARKLHGACLGVQYFMSADKLKFCRVSTGFAGSTYERGGTTDISFVGGPNFRYDTWAPLGTRDHCAAIRSKPV